jgi:hypothetical protein
MRCPTCHRRVAIYDDGAITTASATFVMDGSDVVVTTGGGSSAVYPVGSVGDVAGYHGLVCCGALFDIGDASNRARGAARRGNAAVTLERTASTE